jgi:hypothetical protein
MRVCFDDVGWFCDRRERWLRHVCHWRRDVRRWLRRFEDGRFWRRRNHARRHLRERPRGLDDRRWNQK